ncbi:hypothetical protein [Burkholderia cepacia]|uniref:hypothetical protein n=1 Tax=Burkholderia cepacia TaxID=292 RepID=UPI00159000B9|nr:hypothetical protein [Burkholderia cepacia]
MQTKNLSDWQRAFGKSDAKKVVQVLCEAWRELVRDSAQTFHGKEKEHTLTELLGEYIRTAKTGAGLTGNWTYEDRLGSIVRLPTGGFEVVKRRRTDIQYFSDRLQPALRLVFEFKKIDHTKTRRNAYTGADGMERFVTGDYSVGQPVALMAGMLLKPTSDCVPALRTYLSSAAAQAALGMVANPAGQFVRSPGSFSDAEFDTEHKRPAGKAPAHGSIVICHLFLSF